MLLRSEKCVQLITQLDSNLQLVHGYAMKCTFLGHSAFLLETDAYLLLFDYTKGAVSLPSSTKPLLVFASHRHATTMTLPSSRLQKGKGIQSSSSPPIFLPRISHSPVPSIRWDRMKRTLWKDS